MELFTNSPNNIFDATITPDWDEFFMRRVYLAASKSKDRRTKIGAVIVQEKAVISDGYNGMPVNINDDVEARHERPEKYHWMEHAERNAIYHCARIGVSSKGATMYTQATPCSDCARGIINAGIKRIITHHQFQEAFNKENPQWKESCDRAAGMLFEAGVEISFLDQPLGIITLINGKRIIV